MSVPEFVLENGKKLITVLGPMAADILREKIEKYVEKPHGSKVKDGAFEGCPIELAEDKAVIAVHPEKGEVVLLTSDNIQSYQLMMEKKKLHKVKFKTYYYYYITFRDGSTCYARMRKKYRDAMIRNV